MKTQPTWQNNKPEWTSCTMGKKSFEFIVSLCECRRKYCTYVWAKQNNQQRQLWVLGICVSFPTELGRLWDQREVVVQLFSQTTWLWRVEQVRTATVKNTRKLLLHKKTRQPLNIDHTAFGPVRTDPTLRRILQESWKWISNIYWRNVFVVNI